MRRTTVGGRAEGADSISEHLDETIIQNNHWELF